jgi:hypothetical protein
MTTTVLSKIKQIERSDAWIQANIDEFQEKFNRKSFEVSHQLATHPLLQLPKLMELAERTRKKRPDDLYFDMGDVGIGQRWEHVPERRFSADEALRRIEDSGAWFIFRAAQRDPEYHSLFARGLAEVKTMIGPEIERQIRQEDIIIFITSPNRVTSYHIDRECNFLLQIKGTKTLNVFDREDRDILPEEEIERFWSVDNNAAVYKPQFQNRAKIYKFKPGTGVHIPVNCPHWVKNDDNVSVSLSVNFQFLDSIRADIYRANFFLRRLGFSPMPPGVNSNRDKLKATVMNAAIGARRIITGKLPRRVFR